MKLKTMVATDPMGWKREVYCCARCEEATPFEVQPSRPPAEGYDPRCTNCWEVEHRLPLYLQNRAAREFVEQLLKRARRG